MIRQALAAKLVSAVGASCGNRIRPVFLAQNDTYPAIVFRKLSAGHDPPIADADDLPGPTFEITSWDRTYEDAVTLAEAVRAALENVGSPSTAWAFAGGSVDVNAVTFLDEEDVYDDESVGADKPIYGVRQTYEIIHED